MPSFLMRYSDLPRYSGPPKIGKPSGREQIRRNRRKAMARKSRARNR